MTATLTESPASHAVAASGKPPALQLHEVRHRYGDREALKGVSLAVPRGEVFGLLGPNGGGKTTLMRLLATLLPLQQGTMHVGPYDVASQPDAVRSQLGITFQSPSLDPKLTVWENVQCQGALYGLSGSRLRERGDALLDRLGVLDRRGDLCETLSGGLKRRVEIAKGLLHAPPLLLLDEPSTGLDPGARHDLWTFLADLSRDDGVTVFVSTHLMEEAERCDRLGLLSQGELIGLGTPDALRSEIGGDCVTITPADGLRAEELASRLAERFAVEPTVLGRVVRVEQAAGHDFLREAVEAERPAIASITLGKPTLEDVFLKLTGHRFWDEDARGRAAAEERAPKRRRH